MSEATGQFQVANQPVTIRQLGLPGVPLLRLLPVASATGNALEIRNTSNVVVSAFDVNGTLNYKQHVISGAGATRTLLATESGSTCLFDRAAGIVYTLPAPSVGLYYDFLVSTSVTSNAAKVITDAGTTFLIGSLINIDTDTSNAVAAWTADGSTIVSVSMNGTTTGGLKGTWMRFTCVTSTLWMVTGIDQGNGTVATPFATS